MRFLYISLFMALAGCSPEAPDAGTEGHPCRTGFFSAGCDDGLRCMDSGCVACGSPGEICCAIPGGDEFCHGSACAGGNGGLDDNPGQCTAGCGSIGLACCDNSCPGGGECIGGTCEGQVNDPCFSGSIPHIVNVVGKDCGVVTVTFMTDTVNQAEACRQKLVDAAGPGQEICTLGTKPDSTPVCKQGINGNDQLYLPNCSATQLAVCEEYFCSECTWTTGDCPLP